MRSYFSIIDFNSWENTVLLIKLFSIPLSYKVPPMFSFISFGVWGFTLRSLIHLELILCRMVDMVFISLFYIWTSNFPNIICWKWCVFPPVYIFNIFAISEDSNYIHSCLSVLLRSVGLHVWGFFLPSQCSFFFITLALYIAWNLLWQSLQHWSFCSGLLWLCRGLYCIHRNIRNFKIPFMYFIFHFCFVV